MNQASYRHTFEIDIQDPELSGIHVLDGKLVVRVRSPIQAASVSQAAVEPNFIRSLRCVLLDGQYQLHYGSTVKEIGPNVWKVIDLINRTGRWDSTEVGRGKYLQKIKERVNQILASLGIPRKVDRSGALLVVC